MKIIDAHCHIHQHEWVMDSSKPDFIIKKFCSESRAEQILQNMREAGIDRTVIFPMPSIFIDLQLVNKLAIEASMASNGKLIPFAVVDDEYEKWFALGAKGFKEHSYGQRLQKNAQGNDIYSQRYKKAYAFMAKKGLPLLLHAGVNRVGRIKDDLLNDEPELRIIMAHLGADFPSKNDFKPEMEQVVITLKQLCDVQNVFFDIAAVDDFEIIRAALDIVGPERLIFGSDFPYEPPAMTLQRLEKLGLNQEEKELILSRNIMGLLGETND